MLHFEEEPIGLRMKIRGDPMLYMTTSDQKIAFDFTYPTPDDELHNRLSLQVLARQGPGQWRQLDCFSADAVLFALRESGLIRLREVGG